MGFKKPFLSSTFRPAPNTKKNANTRRKNADLSLRSLRDSSFEPNWNTGHIIVFGYIAAKEPNENSCKFPSGKIIKVNAKLKVTSYPDEGAGTSSGNNGAGSIYIDINFHNSPAHDICKVVEVLSEIRSILKKFTHLVLNVHSSGVEKTLTEAEEESEIDSINEYAKQFVKLMPNVRYLRCNDSVYEEINSVFQKEVIRLLSPRLHYVRCFSNNIESLQHFSKNLLSLKLISQDTCALKSLRIRSDKLKSLVLNNINDDFNWKMFESKKKPGHIDFRNVERMELDTDSYFLLKGGMGKHVYSGPSKPFPFTINAPKLSVLYIKLSPVVFSMLANTQLPKRLLRLEISGIYRVNFILLDVNTKELLRVFSLYKDIGDSNLEHDSIINSLIGNPNVANKIECTIYRPLSFNEIGLLDSRLFINTLDMYKPIAFSNLLALISHMPMLSHVKVAKVSFAKDSEGKVSMPELRKEIEPYADLLPQKLCNMNLAAEEGQNCDGSVWKYIEDFMRRNMKQLVELNVC